MTNINNTFLNMTNFTNSSKPMPATIDQSDYDNFNKLKSAKTHEEYTQILNSLSKEDYNDSLFLSKEEDRKETELATMQMLMITLSRRGEIDKKETDIVLKSVNFNTISMDDFDINLLKIESDDTEEEKELKNILQSLYLKMKEDKIIKEDQGTSSFSLQA